MKKIAEASARRDKRAKVTVYEVWTSQLYEKYVLLEGGERLILERQERPQMPFVKVNLPDYSLRSAVGTD